MMTARVVASSTKASLCLGKPDKQTNHEIIEAMSNKIAYRYRNALFALIMSFSTALIVSGIIIYLHTPPNASFISNWLSAFFTAWPIVFVAILIIPPLINKLLDLFVEKH
jgi:Protein of unknown function (DUF2798)